MYVAEAVMVKAALMNKIALPAGFTLKPPAASEEVTDVRVQVNHKL